MLVLNKTSQKWLTVAIFRKWQDSSVALWIEIALVWTSMVWYGFVWYDFVWFDYNGLS